MDHRQAPTGLSGRVADREASRGRALEVGPEAAKLRRFSLPSPEIGTGVTGLKGLRSLVPAGTTPFRSLGRRADVADIGFVWFYCFFFFFLFSFVCLISK